MPTDSDLVAPPTAIVTGAARGIGAATAMTLRQAGYNVVAFDSCRDDPALSYPLATKADLDDVVANTGAIPFVGDVRLVADLQAAVDLAVQTFGGVDVLVAGAGVVMGGQSLADTTDESWQTQFDVNVTGVFNLVRAGLPALLAQPTPRQGRVVAVSSAAALKASPQIAAYAATKAAVLGLIRSLAAELADTGITANAVQPGTTDTAILQPSLDAYALDDPASFTAHHIDNRLIQPAEVAAAIGWLCSPASQAINGAFIPVDGGMTAR